MQCKYINTYKCIYEHKYRYIQIYITGMYYVNTYKFIYKCIICKYIPTYGCNIETQKACPQTHNACKCMQIYADVCKFMRIRATGLFVWGFSHVCGYI